MKAGKISNEIECLVSINNSECSMNKKFIYTNLIIKLYIHMK